MLQLNITNLSAIMKDFYILTGVRIVIFDADFCEVLSYPREKEDFCTKLRQNPEGEARCKKSDMMGCLKCAESKALVRYRCHAGLTEAVVPIFDKNGVLAYVMFGQVIPKENYNGVKLELVRQYTDYFAEINRLPTRSKEELKAAATILQALTTYMMTNRWVAPEKSVFIRQLDQYIEGHMSQSISVEDICNAFHIGRSRLYEMSLDYLGCGVAEYIRKRRIIHAQTLLVNSSLSVTDVASEAGFMDYNHFSRVFKKMTGCSARDYRKKRVYLQK